ncbi:ModD protein [Desulfuromonas acetoxidans]|uniref:Putative pyrophosphorylase ModD n=1 Tax=Desulfuromonas acetoxidans (strain DSM 684 / 11070) TaxID=281689 RepID=Q1K2D0_DESA6|nr:ModD protein [Desulfuromonas acetoxidans]EAT16509.1 modD protein [Desulfuromonas acetoxidans DSM 684]MBF0646747.1 ModD protein [Desulfuromonas acetoxidans]NVD26143.1 ModD protein [Desulfuromonas acetoxidans]NVE17958.1 ModD protein [Desulfuromonas acetoxidans]
MFINQTMVDQWIEEDVPGLDLTSHLLEMAAIDARMCFATRHETTVAGVTEAAGVFRRLGAEVVLHAQSGQALAAGETLMEVSGNAEALHAGWRVALNLLEYAGGIATRTAGLVSKAQKEGVARICGTRKAFPGARRLSQQALIAGGGIPHRLGLGESVLIFAHHYDLIGFERFVDRLPALKAAAPEKKIGVEVTTLQQARQVAARGADSVQLDKCSVEELNEMVTVLKRDFPDLLVIAAGGINGDNVAAYAATGVDLLVTSWMYFGKPADISAHMTRC